MALLVVALAPSELELLTLSEWDSLMGCERVLFERPDHPLLVRLRGAGIDAGPFDDELEPAHSGWALVCDPQSPRLIELASKGAQVSVGSFRAPDSLTAARGASVVRRAAKAAGELVLIMARLRSPEGCPWDLEQDHETLRVHLLEEAYEVIDAIESKLLGAELEEELGDLLLQVVFHAQMADDEGRFDIAGVAEGIAGKLLSRHPHVFGDVSVGGAADVVANWERIKAAEKQRSDIFDDIPRALPALLAAYKTQKRAASVGFESTFDDASDRAKSALDATDIGGVLFWTVAMARAAGVDPETALRSTTSEFRTSVSSGDHE